MRQPLHLITDGSSSLNSSFSQIVSRLKIHPELSRGVEVNGQPDCQISADPELAFHKLFDLTFGPFRGHGQVHDGHAQRLHKLLIQNLAR